MFQTRVEEKAYEKRHYNKRKEKRIYVVEFGMIVAASRRD